MPTPSDDPSTSPERALANPGLQLFKPVSPIADTAGEQQVTIAQLGCGYWGPNLLRNFHRQRGCRVAAVAEQSESRRDYVSANYPGVAVTPNWQDVLEDDGVDAVVVATPAATHAEIVTQCLDAGKHVLVEKPLALNTADADDILAHADAAGKLVMVGHTFLFNDALRKLKKLKDEGEFGDLQYLYSQRLNLGQVRSDVNAWWNLAPHDVSMLLYLMDDELPASVSAQGLTHLQPGIEDVVFAVLRWESGVAAHIHVSWLDPNKTRKMTLAGTRRMAIYDDVGDDKITIMDKGFEVVPADGHAMDFDNPASYQTRRRWGDVWVPRCEVAEPLSVEAAHFLDCIRSGEQPLTGGRHARDTVAVLEAVDRCLAEQRPGFEATPIREAA